MMKNSSRIVSNRANKLASAWCINSLAYSIIYPFIPLYLHNNRGFSMNTVSWIFPLMGIGIMIGPIIAGTLVDLLGRRVLLIGGPVIRGGVFFLLAFFAYKDCSFIYFAIALMFSSCFGAFFENSSDAYLTDLAPPEERSKVYSRIRVGTNIGWALGPMIGAFLAQTPFSLLFCLTGGLCVSGAIFVAITCPKIKHRRTLANSREFSDNVKGEHSLKDMLKHYQFIFTVFFYFLLIMLISQLYSTMSVYSTQVVGISKNMLGIIYSINGFTVVFFQVLLTKYLDKSRLNLYLRIIIGAIFYAIGYFSLGFAVSAAFLMGAVILITVGEIIVHPAAYALISTMAPQEWIGRYMGGLGMMRGIGYAIGPWLGMRLFARFTDYPVILWGILASLALTAIVGFIIIKYKFDTRRMEIFISD
jgi:MFS family permease